MSPMPTPTQGGVVIRIVHRAQTRLVEWLAGFQTMFLGLVLFHPGETFGTSQSFTFFRSIASEDTWAVFLFVLGVVRIGGLIINGARQEITPTIRAIGALVGFFVFFGFTYGFLVSYLVNDVPPTTGLAMYGPAAVAELAAIVYSVRDAKAYRDGKRAS